MIADKLITNVILARLDRIEKTTLLTSKSVLTIEDVALLTGLAKSTIYKMTSQKEIPHYKPRNKTIFFDKTEVEQWMMTNKIGG